MLRVAVFVDGANFFYMQRNSLRWFADPKRILEYCRHFGDVVDAYYYIGKDALPEATQQAYLTALTYMGYSLVTKPIKNIYDPNSCTIKQKANLDIEIVLDMFNTIDNYDLAILISGDGDFERPLQLLKARGKIFKVISAPGFIATELRTVAGMHYIDMNDIRGDIERI